MADTNPSTPSEHEIPSFQPWLRVMTAAFIPIFIAFFVPQGVKVYLFVIAGALLIAGGAMFIRQERAAKRGTQH